MIAAYAYNETAAAIFDDDDDDGHNNDVDNGVCMFTICCTYAQHYQGFRETTRTNRKWPSFP